MEGKKRSKFLWAFLLVFILYTVSVLGDLLVQRTYSMSLPFIIYSIIAILVANVSQRNMCKYMENKKSRNMNVIFFVASLIIVLSGTLLYKSYAPPLESKYKFEVTATGVKNKNAKSSEVWIVGIKDGNKNIDLKDIETTEGWEKKDGKVVSYRNQPSTLVIQGFGAGKITLIFESHDWSGNVELKYGNETETLDLYSTTPNEVSKMIDLKLKPSKWGDYYRIILFYSLNLMMVMIGLIEFYYNNKNDIIGNVIAIQIYNFLSSLSNVDIVTNILITGIIVFASFYKWETNSRVKNRESNKELVLRWCLSLLASIYVILIIVDWSKLGSHLLGFAQIAYSALTVTLIIEFVLNFMWRKVESIFINEVSLYDNEKIRAKLIYFFVPVIISTFYLICVFPGIMTPDSLDQWAQAHGVYGLNNLHPVTHTLLIRLLSTIWDSPATLAFFQIVVFALTLSYLSLLLKRLGWSTKKIIALEFIFCLIPTNALLIVTLWKDIIYSIFVLLLTLLLADFLLWGEQFAKNKIKIIIFLTVSTCICLLRHNGIAPVIATYCLLIATTAPRIRKRVICAFVVVMMTVTGCNMTINSVYSVVPVQKGYGYQSIVHGLAKVIKFEKMDSGDEILFSKIMPISEWKKLYYPYSINNYLFNNKNYPFIEVLSEDRESFLKVYIKYLLKQPIIIGNDLLEMTSIVWQVFEPQGGYNCRFLSEIVAEVKGDNSATNLGIVYHETVLSRILFTYGSASHRISLGDALFWRNGISLFIILILSGVFIGQKKYKHLIIFAPVLGNNLSLITMIGQDFKYVYPSFLCTWAILLILWAASENVFKGSTS